MKLIYRGTTFEYDLSQRRVNNSFQPAYSSREPYTLMYRGVTYQINPSAKEKASIQPRDYELTYRGVTYFIHHNGQEKLTQFSQVGNAIRSSQIEDSNAPVERHLIGVKD
jgi:hypothetical protein